MAIKYKTKLTKVSASSLKSQLWELLSQCDSPRVQGEEGEQQFIIYHAIKVIKLPGGAYSVKIFEKSSNNKERYIELDNLYILHLLVENVTKEIETTVSK